MATNHCISRVGIGLYSIPEAARLVGASSRRVRRWIDPEYGLFQRCFDPAEETISFLELMELQFINVFRSEGVSLETIRKAAIAAARRFDTPCPFAVRRFNTDGRTVFATLIDEEANCVLVEDLRRGQYVFDQTMRPLFRKVEYGPDGPMRYWPLGQRGRVVLDPQRHFGKPIDAETGVPTRALYEAIEAGQDPPVVADWFGVPLAAVTSAVQFEKSLAA